MFKWLVCLTLILVIAMIAVPYFFPQSTFCLEPFANFGQGISGIASLISMPLLLITLILQTQGLNEARKNHEQEIAEKSFEAHCKSIESGLAFIKNQEGTIEGGAAIIRYGELCARGTITFHITVNQLTVDGLKSVVAALSDLIDWIDLPKNKFKFHSFFRVRFMSLIMGFEKMLPAGTLDMTEPQLLANYGQNQRQHSLILAIHRLSKKEFNSWVNYQEATSSPN